MLPGVPDFPHFKFSSLPTSASSFPDYETGDADFVSLLQQTEEPSSEALITAAVNPMATVATLNTPSQPRPTPLEFILLNRILI